MHAVPRLDEMIMRMLKMWESLKQRRRQLQKMSEIYDLIGLMRKYNRAARAARTFVEFSDLVCQTTNLRIFGFNDNVNTHQ